MEKSTTILDNRIKIYVETNQQDFEDNAMRVEYVPN